MYACYALFMPISLFVLIFAIHQSMSYQYFILQTQLSQTHNRYTCLYPREILIRENQNRRYLKMPLLHQIFTIPLKRTFEELLYEEYQPRKVSRNARLDPTILLSISQVLHVTINPLSREYPGITWRESPTRADGRSNPTNNSLNPNQWRKPDLTINHFGPSPHQVSFFRV